MTLDSGKEATTKPKGGGQQDPSTQAQEEEGSKNEQNAKQEKRDALSTLQEWHEQYQYLWSSEAVQKIKIPALVALVAIVATGHVSTFFKYVVYPLYWLVLKTLAVAVGVALGLGFAMHVYEQLEVWADQTRRRARDSTETSKRRRKSQKNDTKALLMEHLRSSASVGLPAASSTSQTSTASGKQLLKSAPTSSPIAKLMDPAATSASLSSYAELMASAGYEVDINWKRGQVVREFLPKAYPFCDCPVDRQYAIQVMQQEYPSLPPAIRKELGRFMEFIMRDYVSTWYSMLDGGIPYPDCCQRAKDKAACLERGEEWIEPPPLPPPKPHPFPRHMVFSTASTRNLPLLEHIYRSMAVLFGNLSHRVQDVNAFRLVLLKFTKVVAHTFKVYRQLRKALLDKQSVRKIALFDEARGGVGRALMRSTVNVVKESKRNLENVASSIRLGGEETALPNFGVGTGAAGFSATSSIAESSDDGGLSGYESGLSSDDPTAPQPQLPPQPYQPVSEIALTREFLVTGKLHPACTFGLEVPSLLFSDPSGKDCGTGVENDNDEKSNDDGNDDDDAQDNDNERGHAQDGKNKKKKDEDQVLEERLFHTKLIEECELDYNRVIASRIIKLLIPRQDYGSPIVGAILTEILGGCVLTPLMSCFHPDYLNYWVYKAVGETDEEQEDGQYDKGAAKNAGAKSGANTPTLDGETKMRSWGEDDDENTDEPGRARSFSEENGEVVLSDSFNQQERQELSELMDLSTNEGEDDLSMWNKEAAEEFLGTTPDTSTQAKSDADNDSQNSVDVDDDEIEDDDDVLEEATNAAGTYRMITLLDDALLDLQRHMDLDDYRRNRAIGDNKSVQVNWDDAKCKAAVLRLVLVIEALLMHGRRQQPIQIVSKSEEEENEDEKETVEEEFNSGTLIQILMDLTSDIEAFERLHVKPGDTIAHTADEDNSEENEHDSNDAYYEPTASDLSTLRTLIAAWLHTGQVYRTIGTLAKAKTTVLRPFYHAPAFLRNSQTSTAFVRQLKALDGVDVMVDTVAILNSPKIDPEQEIQSQQHDVMLSAHQKESSQPEGKPVDEVPGQKKTGFKVLLDKGMQNLNDKKKAIEKAQKDFLKGRNPLSKSVSIGNPKAAPATGQPSSNREIVATTTTAMAATPGNYSQMLPSSSGGDPRYLEYHKNEAFALSLRSERDRRMQSWVNSIQNDTEMLQVVCRIKGASPEDTAYHRELHHIARILYAGTNVIGIRDAARSTSNAPLRTSSMGSGGSQGESSTGDILSPEVSLLTVEMACARRKIEIPDDDSSFLLRAQPRALNSIGVHRDTRNADQSYRSFAGSFEEPAVLPGTKKYAGGRYVRRCQLRYYPSDRTASIAMVSDARKLDQRKGQDLSRGWQQSGTASPVPFLSPEFLRDRHLCQKWIPKGSTSRSQPGMLSSNVMEQADFTAAPRTGKALDFVYRMSLFECPMIDLGGKRFTIHDSASQNTHRADASALEMSDAALSAALLVIGRDYKDSTETKEVGGIARNKVELGPDGYPIIWMKYSRKQSDGTTSTEIKPYRVSFMRAAMLITSTRQEAQLQCLVKCVKAGSAKSATKARTDAQLRPTLRLLDYARDRNREKQERLMRDLKLGINHIDREQLRRNAILSPRYPTVVRSIQVSIEKAIPAKDANVKIAGNNPQRTVYKIRCVATVELVDEEIPQELLEPYLTSDGKRAATYKESWVIYRPFGDFQALHKHLKGQVASSESSGTASSRLVGAATAAFTAGGPSSSSRGRQRSVLIPSLGNANKAGALGVTQRAVAKRMEILDGYLHQLLSVGHQLSGSQELLMFIGAFYPLPQEVQLGKLPISILNDPLGRAEMSREVLKLATPSLSPSGIRIASSRSKDEAELHSSVRKAANKSESSMSLPASWKGSIAESEYDESKEGTKMEKVNMTNPVIVSKIDNVPLGQVRNRVFELLTYQFGFENASFFRGRMLSAIKTMSFAVTTPHEFRKTLYKAHTEHISAEALAYWINYGIDMLWPNGVFYESAPALTPEEQKSQSDRARDLLHSCFPDQLRTVLGQELTRDGLDVLHEMLQNRMVMKSMFYMLFDLVWEEIFPEMKDVLSCGDAIDIDFDEE